MLTLSANLPHAPAAAAGAAAAAACGKCGKAGTKRGAKRAADDEKRKLHRAKLVRELMEVPG